jgi:cell volume regulation protein A
MIGMLELATHPGDSWLVVVKEFSIEMAVGAVVGIVAGMLLLRVNNHASLPSRSLYPLLTLACALTIYGGTALVHGSGFLAVFVAGLIAGSADFVAKRETERFHAALANLAEIVVFVALGLTVTLADVWRWNVGGYALVLAVVLALVARPAVVLALLAPARLRWEERVFVAWAGLKGAVPILLAAFAVLAGVRDAERIYLMVFVVVMFSVVIQGSLIATVARRLGIPIVDAPRE